MTFNRQGKQPEVYTYIIYGLRIHSNHEIPGLMTLFKSGNSDIDITFTERKSHHTQPTGAQNLFRSPGIADNGEPFFKVWRNQNDQKNNLGIQYTNGAGYTTFLINNRGTQVLVSRTKSMPIQDMLTYFLGPVIGCILRVRKVTCLHAGVVAVNGRALAIIGPKGAGKSTTTAALADFGLAVLSDDIAPLTEVDGNYTVAPGYLSLRLWPNTISVLSDVSSDKLTKVLSIADKHFLKLSSDKDAERWKFHAQPMQLAAVYALNERGQSDSISIDAQSQATGLLKLAGNVYPEYSLHQSDRSRDFAVLGKLAAKIPVRTVTRPDNLETLSQLRDAILTDFKTLISE